MFLNIRRVDFITLLFIGYSFPWPTLVPKIIRLNT